ncbi:MAG: hypothetical protein JNL36_06590 [Candidatus Kapabacteria bacterium]|nr:hypothetical protein [Candidatus Kapabacteria bacterium]
MDNQNLIQKIDIIKAKIEENETLVEDLKLELLKKTGEFNQKGMEYIKKPDNIDNDYVFGEEYLRHSKIMKDIESKLEMTTKLILDYNNELDRLNSLL